MSVEQGQRLRTQHPEQTQQTVVAHEAEVAHRGLGLIARMRLSHAEGVVDLMDHKDALYAELGAAAVAGLRQPPRSERPETIGERILDFRLQRRSDKKARAAAYAYRTAKNHGPDMARPIPSVRQGITESALGIVTDREPSHSLFDVIAENTKRVFVGASIPGYSRIKRLWEHTKVTGAALTGSMTAAERRARRTEINATRLKLGNKMHKVTRREARRRNERAGMAAEQPILSRWRDGRRRRAQRVIDHYTLHED